LRVCFSKGRGSGLLIALLAVNAPADDDVGGTDERLHPIEEKTETKRMIATDR
jgi:hypothetical protein